MFFLNKIPKVFISSSSDSWTDYVFRRRVNPLIEEHQTDDVAVVLIKYVSMRGQHCKSGV